jgi:RNA polymerase sigma-70 factor (ECF subfamily)
LHTVLRNIAIDRLRRQRLESEHSGTGLPPEGTPESPIEARSECEAALRHLLSQVSPAEAAAILLCDVFEYDYYEIARIVGKNNAAFRQFLHRARMRAHCAESSADVEEVYVGLCWRAIEARDPRPLINLLQRTTSASVHQPAVTGERQRGARCSSRLVHVDGRYAIALVLDGVVLCLVPVGTRAASMGEPA